MRWADFAASAPALAATGRDRLDRSGLVMLGTLRRDGAPRITPIEFFLFEDDLTLSGMWRSVKMLDLLRDPRCVLHSTTSRKEGDEGDFKLAGRALPEDDAGYRERWGAALAATTGWRPEGPFHLFRLDVERAAFALFGDDAPTAAERLRADPATRVREFGADPNTSRYVVADWVADRRAARGGVRDH